MNDDTTIDQTTNGDDEGTDAGRETASTELEAMPEGTGLPIPQGMPPAMALWFDDKLFNRARLIAKYLSEAKGFVPPHLLGKPQACFAVVERSLTWRLSPYAVAASTYETPGGKVGYEGKLCQAILENSGRLVGPVKYEHYGDWSKVQGKFEIKNGNNNKPYPHRTWGPTDAKGLGVIVRAQVRGEPAPREWSFELIQAFPLNSTLWATDPKTQICYTAVRRFGSVAAPGLFMGVPFDRNDYDDDPADNARDVTPPTRPTRNGKSHAEPEAARAAEAETFELISADGEIVAYTDPAAWAAAFIKILEAAPDEIAVEDIWKTNSPTQLETLRGLGTVGDKLAQEIGAAYGSALDSKRAAGRKQPAQKKAEPQAAKAAEPDKRPEPEPEPEQEQEQDASDDVQLLEDGGGEAEQAAQPDEGEALYTELYSELMGINEAAKIHAWNTDRSEHMRLLKDRWPDRHRKLFEAANTRIKQLSPKKR